METLSSGNQPTLIVDDSSEDCEVAELILNEAGLTNVSHTDNIENAIQILQKNNDIKQVILDLGGVVKKGKNAHPLAAIEALEKANIPDLQVIILSGNKNPEIERQIQQKGYQYLLKDTALNLSENSRLLPEAIARLSTSSTDLEQSIYIRELLLRVNLAEQKISQLENRIIQVSSEKTVTAEVLSNQEDSQKKLLALGEEIAKINAIVAEVSWVIFILKCLNSLGRSFLQLIRDLLVKYTGLLFVTIIAAMFTFSSGWLPSTTKKSQPITAIEKFINWSLRYFSK
jgi:CheY-like chemotaxis protein